MSRLSPYVSPSKSTWLSERSYWSALKQRMTNRLGGKIPALICVSMIAGMLAIGLFPFRSPTNGVEWLTNTQGIRFRGDGSILSEGVFANGPRFPDKLTLEIWLEPARNDISSAILAFSGPPQSTGFTLAQYRSDLMLEAPTRNSGPTRVKASVDNILQKRTPLFVTLTSDTRQSAAYIQGNLVDTFPGFLFQKGVGGRLVIGTSPTGTSTWLGELRGLAIYNEQLTPEQVSRHYSTWISQGRPTLSERDSAVALYLFNEGQGRVVHNLIAPGIDLAIPERYTVLHLTFLQPFWKEYRKGLGYWIDLAVNLFGFVPLGFTLNAYWTLVNPKKHPALLAVLLGFAVSLTIELLQSLIPTRNSGTTDLITNTLGTYLGVVLNRHRFFRFLSF